MPLEPVARHSLGDQVFDQLASRILSGEFGAGSPLPSERTLVDLFGVNRQAVREAIKRLEQAGLVDVQHGGRTTVTNWRRRAGLDLLPRLVIGAEGKVEPSVVRSIMEFRALIGPEVAARCADRMVPAVRDVLVDLQRRYRQVDTSTTFDELAELDTELWHALVDGSDNIAFRLAYNALRTETAGLDGLLARLLEDEFTATDLRIHLIERAMAGDAAGARVAATDLLALGTETIARAMAAVPARRRRRVSQQ